MSGPSDARDVDTAYEPERVVVRDKRRIDPQTGAPRGDAARSSAAATSADGEPEPAAFGADGPDPAQPGDSQPGDSQPGDPRPGDADLGAAHAEAARDAVAELTADLQRLSAEYANYRKRVVRDQAAVGELALAALVERLLPLLDDVDRAREHGDLDGAFKTVGEGLEGVVARLGVERFGAVGDAFDPQVHEAVMQAPEEPDATVATCVQVFAPGYRLASGRVLRPAKVVVAEPGAVPVGPGFPAGTGPEA